VSLFLFGLAGCMAGGGLIAIQRGWPRAAPRCVVLPVCCGLMYLLTGAAIWVGGGKHADHVIAVVAWTAGVVMVCLGWRHWRRRHRRGRKRAGKLIGEKSRQVRAALVKTMRERARPRPVIRPGRVPA
jgi:hypothetical protein